MGFRAIVVRFRAIMAGEEKITPSLLLWPP
jgi:hypothetical protein